MTADDPCVSIGFEAGDRSGVPKSTTRMSGPRVLAIDIHTSDGEVRRLTDVSKCELSVLAVPPHPFAAAAVSCDGRRYDTVLIASAATSTTYPEPKPASKRKGRR